MRRIRNILLVTFLLALSAESQAAPGDLRVGAAAAEMVADDTMVIAGGIGPGLAKGQEGQLRSVAVVIEKPPFAKVAIVQVDVLFAPADLVNEALAEIKSAAGILPENVLVNATHTHHAPSVTEIHGCKADSVFKVRMEAAIVQSVLAANENLNGGECRFFYGSGEEKTVGSNSRLRMKDGMIYWIGSTADAVGPTGPFDPQLQVLAFRDDRERVRALIYNHSTHTIGTRKGAVRSPGFYGLAAQELEEQFGDGAIVSFLEGASGSTHNITGVSTPDAVKRLKAAVSDTLGKAKEFPVTHLKSMKRPVTFKVGTFDENVEEEKVVTYCRKYAPADADRIAGVFRAMRKELAPQQGQERTTTVQAIRIGDVAIVGVPAEYFTVLGLDIKKRSPFPNTIVAELANDWVGYLPDRGGQTLGGYQTWIGLHSFAEVGTGERMADIAVGMLKELAEK